jgi:hypothetical protein
MKKRTYRAVEVKKVDWERLAESLAGKELVVGADVGKEVCFASLRGEGRDVLVTVKWKSPWEDRGFVEFLGALGCSSIEVAMEPSGSYGDPLRRLLWEAGIRVYRVSGKRSHDAAEVYDGVPSWHDAKSAGIVAKLHKDGASEPWPFRSEAERDLCAVVRTMELLDGQFRQNVNRLEGQMARHWPEVGAWLDLGCVTFLELIVRFGGPQQIGARQQEARDTMRTVGGRFLKQEKVEAVVASDGPGGGGIAGFGRSYAGVVQAVGGDEAKGGTPGAAAGKHPGDEPGGGQRDGGDFGGRGRGSAALRERPAVGEDLRTESQGAQQRQAYREAEDHEARQWESQKVALPCSLTADSRRADR